MKCRALSDSNNIIWFGKTGEPSAFQYWISIPSLGIKGYQEDHLRNWTFSEIPTSDIYFAAFENTEFNELVNTTFGDLMSISTTPVVTINGTTYLLIYDYGSELNGSIYTWGLGSRIGEFSYTNKPVNNYHEGAEGVADSLTQRLSVIKGELWYQINFGLPLTDKHSSPVIFDMVIADIITAHPAVAGLKSFTSQKTGHTYSFNGVIQTIFGEELSISNSYSV